MKHTLLLSAALVFFSPIWAQVPQGITHQAVIRNTSNELLTNKAVGIRASILQGTADGTSVYIETHYPSSNAQGLITYVIGQGTAISGDFSAINWAAGPYFLKTEADPEGGINYTITGTTQFLSVPYALFAGSIAINTENGILWGISVNENGDLVPYSISDPTCPKNIVDYDGNVYSTALIGKHCVMAENLKTIHYRNGTPIENPVEIIDWDNNIAGAYCWYDNDPSWKDIYGALYNHYAVINKNGLCPSGWHVPSVDEYKEIIKASDFYYSMDPDLPPSPSEIAGGKMKSTLKDPDPHPRWDNPNDGATNKSRFSGLPGGKRIQYAEPGNGNGDKSQITFIMGFLYSQGE